MQRSSGVFYPRRGRLAAVLLLFGVAYFLSLFFRTVNAILATKLEADLGLDAASLGLLTAAYFLGLGLTQIPIGLCLDAYGPRRVQAVLLLIAALGIGAFGLLESVPLLVVARALIGIGLAGCLVAAYQVSSLWVVPERAPLANGLYLAVGGLGVLAATTPVEFMMDFMSWRELFVFVAVGTALVAIAVAVVTPDPPMHEATSWAERISGLAVVTRNEEFRRYLPMTALCFGTGTAMQGLWASTWLRDVAGYDSNAIAWSLTAMALALTVGSAAGGVASVLVERMGFHLTHVVLGNAILFVAAEIGILLAPLPIAPAFWILFALTYNAVTLSYAHVARSQPIAFVGRSNTLMNTAVILTTFALQYGLGLFLSRTSQWFPERAYSIAIATLMILQICAIAWCCWPLLKRRS
ncbi:MFS transporter [Aurantimonas sp. DM33-3]|uniref:MFS transporter n=1 Tax=Aurantimonas sp. DM33-3 TaxID=2766955 RepID=UPI001652A9C5|nr:MFS transporter [Aurantimonas sp. DM33-3]MBC6718611.1 MFS transporter [Aurantimonas sp. DM33-3]